MALPPETEFESNLRKQGYVPLPDFAIIDECDFTDRKTGQRVNLDKQRLQRIAGEHNKLIDGSGSAPVICLGHTKDDAAEADQPPVVGVATSFRVGKFRDGRHAIFAKPWAKPGSVKLDPDKPEKTYVQLFRDNPQRSSEVWLNPDAINPIALLGSTTPRRDLGLHLAFSRDKINEYEPADYTSSGSVIRFSKTAHDGRFPILFQMKDGDEDMSAVKCEEPGGSEADMAAASVGESATIKSLQEQNKRILEMLSKWAPVMDALMQEEEAAAAQQAAPGQPGGDQPPPQADQGPPQDGPPAKPEEEEDKPERNSAAYSPAAYAAPGYGNTTMPTYDRPERNSRRDEVAVRLSRMEAESVRWADEKKIMLSRMQSAEQAGNAARLELLTDKAKQFLAEVGQHVVIDEQRDFDHIVRLSRDKWPAEREYMLKVRAKVVKEDPLPGSAGFVVAPESISGPIRNNRPASALADPAVAATGLPDEYDAMVAMFQSSGKSAQQFLQQPVKPATGNPTVAVR